MRLKLLFYSLLICHSVFAQIPSSSVVFFAKEFSKDIALYKAKAFVMNEVFGVSDKPIKFELDPLAASMSGELTSLAYKCSEKNMEGLVLGFYGDRWNDAGVIYQSYAFKNLPKPAAIELLNKIQSVIDAYSGYLGQTSDNNVYYKYEDMTFLI